MSNLAGVLCAIAVLAVLAWAAREVVLGVRALWRAAVQAVVVLRAVWYIFATLRCLNKEGR